MEYLSTAVHPLTTANYACKTTTATWNLFPYLQVKKQHQLECEEKKIIIFHTILKNKKLFGIFQGVWCLNLLFLHVLHDNFLGAYPHVMLDLL